MTNKLPFVVGHTYSRKDIYELLYVPLERQKGNWNTGYHRYNDDWFIFANINTSGRTSIGNDLCWFGRTNSHLSQPNIRLLLNPKGNVFIFIRKDNRNKFTYIGRGSVKEYKDTVPVNIIWRIEE